MKAQFVFMDDSEIKELAIAALTGLVIPLDRYQDVRARFYDGLRWAIIPGDGQLVPHPPELHGSKLLPDENTERRLKQFDAVVSLVLDCALSVYRVGYYVTQDLVNAFRYKEKPDDTKYKKDRRLLGLCWFAMANVLQSVTAEGALVPVMDGFNPDDVRTFSGMIKEIDTLREVGYEHVISLKHTQNLYGEVFFADSRYSLGIQLVDIVSYLRRVTDLKEGGVELSPFKQKLLPIAQRLEPVIVHDEITVMKLDGKP